MEVRSACFEVDGMNIWLSGKWVVCEWNLLIVSKRREKKKEEEEEMKKKKKKENEKKKREKKIKLFCSFESIVRF